jgi:hypothetical protein
MVTDAELTGESLLARIDELTIATCYDGMSTNGWRAVLAAAAREIRELQTKRNTAERLGIEAMARCHLLRCEVNELPLGNQMRRLLLEILDGKQTGGGADKIDLTHTP